MSVYPLSFSKLQTFEQCEQKYDYLYVSKTVRDAGNQYTDYGTRVHEALEKYAKGEASLPPELARFRRLVDRILRASGEKRFEAKLAVDRRYQPTDWDSPDAYMRGIVDVLVIDGEKAYDLDWKTGKPKDDDRKLRLMSLLTFAHYPSVSLVDTMYVWLHHNQTSQGRYRRTEAPTMWNTFDLKATKVKTAVELGVFKARPSPLCGWCAAKGICPSAR